MSDASVIYNAIIVVVCVLCAACASGMTQGLLSLDIMEMQIKQRSGTPQEKKYSTAVIPLIKRHHLLLVSLLLWNATASEALPIFLDELVPEWVAIVLSVTMILFVGEIVPAAILTGPNQLELAAGLSPVIYVVLVIFAPIAYPISIALDYVLGHDEGITTYNRKEFSTMMKIQREERLKRGEGHLGVTKDEVSMIHGILHFRGMIIKDVMTKDIFMLSIDGCFDFETMNKIFKSGYSRIPIYDKDQNDIVGILLAKDLLFIDPEDKLPMRNFMQLFSRTVQTIWPEQTLGDALKVFNQSRSHLAIVVEVNNTGALDPFYEVKGLITLEDIFVKIMGEDLLDETDEPDDVLNVAKELHRDIEITRTRLLDPSLLLHGDNKLSTEEIQAITAHISATAVGDVVGNDTKLIEELVAQSQVVEVSRMADEKELLDEDCLIRRGEACHTCILVLTGKVLVLAGNDQFQVELGPWTALGQDCLVNEGGEIYPDFSVYLLSDRVKYLKMTKAKKPADR